MPFDLCCFRAYTHTQSPNLILNLKFIFGFWMCLEFDIGVNNNNNNKSHLDAATIIEFRNYTFDCCFSISSF